MTPPPTVPDDTSWHRVHPAPTGEVPRYRILVTPADVELYVPLDDAP